MANRNLTAERLRELLQYDPETGLFTRKVSVNGRFGQVGRVCGSPDKKGHIYIFIDGDRYAAHRMAWMYTHGKWPTDQIDHVNRQRDDNRIANLREATAQINNQNKARPLPNNRSGFLGVSICGAKFRAVIRASGVIRHLGVFDTAQEAHYVYIEAKRRLHGGCTI